MLAVAPGGRGGGTQEPPAYVIREPRRDVRRSGPLVSTFAERTALPGDLDRVLAALLARHGRAVGLAVHALAEGAVVLLPLLLVGPQLVVHPAAGLGAVH